MPKTTLRVTRRSLLRNEVRVFFGSHRGSCLDTCFSVGTLSPPFAYREGTFKARRLVRVEFILGGKVGRIVPKFRLFLMPPA